MNIVLDLDKTAHQNAAIYYEKAKKFEKKMAGARKSLTKTIKQKKDLNKKKGKQKAKWFEEFHWFYTSKGKLCVAGKNAKQNELLVAKRLTNEDLFFHADVHGAPTTILKNGVQASEEELIEAAQWACIYSRAWKGGSVIADAYCVKKDQVSKYSSGEFVGKGAFMIYGERQWFRNMELKLKLLKEGNIVRAIPEKQGGNGVLIEPGQHSKVAVAKKLHEKWEDVSLTLLDQLLPGNSRIS